MKQARKADGTNGQEIIDFFEKINPRCNKYGEWMYSVGEINILSGKIFYLDYDGDLVCSATLPEGYELTEPSGESEFSLTQLLYKYKDQKPKEFGENYAEKCYPVSALLEIAEAYSTQQNKELKEEIERLKECLKNCTLKWQPFDFLELETRPQEYGKYLVCRKDGKIHWETWNNSGWAYNHNEVRFWAVITKPNN